MKRLLWVCALLVAMVALNGCQKKGCEGFVEKATECSMEGVTMERCTAMSTNNAEVFAQYEACLEKSSCDDFKACITEVEEKEREARRVEREKAEVAEVNAALEKGDFEDKQYACQSALEEADANADLKAACTAYAGAAFAKITEQVTGLRDNPPADERTGYIAPCSDLEHYAKMLGEEQVKAQATLCAEAEYALGVGEALAEAKANVDAKTAEVPTSCRVVDPPADAAATDAMKALYDKMLVACYVEIGKLILAEGKATIETKKAAESFYSCPVPVTMYLKQYDELGLKGKDADLDATITGVLELSEGKCKVGG